MSDSLQPPRLQPARLLCPWDSTGKNTAVGCHTLLQGMPISQCLDTIGYCVHAQSLQSCQTLCNPMDCRLLESLRVRQYKSSSFLLLFFKMFRLFQVICVSRYISPPTPNSLALGGINPLNFFTLFQILFVSFFFFFFLVTLALHCCLQAFFSCHKQGLLPVAVHRLLIVLASLIAEHGLQVHRLQQFRPQGSRAWAQQLGRIDLVAPRQWDFLRPEIKPMSPALANGFLSTIPPRKPIL